jgi:general secretion pathway protein K
VRRRKQSGKQRGFALLLSLIAIAILSVLVIDLHETTGMSFSAATAERDMLRAEYLAKSGVNLTRMLIGQEKNLRAILAAPYQLMLKRPPPQLPVWRFADALLKPFANFDAAKGDIASAGVDLDATEGLGKTHGSFRVAASAENGKVNVNDPRMQDMAIGQANVGGLFYGLLGGYQPSPNKYDPLFTQPDEKGRATTRLDLVSSVIDWWDQDEQRAAFDPLMGTMQAAGAEDAEYYRSQREPYRIKNAPFDTLEELRLVQGMSDDVWATFVEPDLEDPTRRQVTIYGLSRVNPNEAEPAVLLARICTFKEVREQPLCNDPLESTKFITLLATARSMAGGVPWFSRGSDFIAFITGAQEGLYGMLSKLLGGGGGGMGALLGGGGGGAGGKSSLLFTPLKMQEGDAARNMRRMFATTGYQFTIEVTGRSGNAQRRIRAVINTDPQWTPPKPNAGKLPPLGIFAYYRLD